MAVPTSKSTFKEYCLRALGKGVIDINVSDDQADDRIDEALQYFTNYHSDGIERVYLKHKLTEAEVTRMTTNEDAVTATDKIDSSITADWLQQENYIPTPESVLSVVKVYPLTDKLITNMFDVRYQLRLNDLYDLTSTSIVYYTTVMGHLSLLDMMLNGKTLYRFNRMQNRLFIDLDWRSDVKIGDFILVDVYKALNPNTYTKVYGEPWMKKYTTALFKKQWGLNLKKFSGLVLPGGVSMDGDGIYNEAMNEIQQLEDELIGKGAPLEFFTG